MVAQAPHRGLITYRDVEVAYQAVPQPASAGALTSITADYVATNAEIRPSLGRDLGQCRGLAPCNASVVINTVPDTSYFEDRLRQTDIRFTRTFRVGKIRVRGNGDLYNLFNASNVLNMTTRYSGTNGGQWRRPLQILGGRMFKFSAQLDF